ncbi:hypothetical protein QT971_30560 [Microcoleus sp. herbarium19]|uniref:hypothetical protein n=1 Tax=unclassified Microcoleus TaxID=2642155 RepID=UPI002FCFF294
MMKVATIAYNNVAIQLSSEEVEFFLKLVQEVQQVIPNSFTTRVNTSPRQARGFFESILQDIKQSGESLINISFLFQEICLLQNLLNEACNAIVINDFEIKLGKSKEEAKELLEWVCNVTKEMEALKEARRASYMPSPSNLPKPEEANKCCLEADGYLITFYIRKLLSSKNVVNLFIVLNIGTTQLVAFSISSVPKPIEVEDLCDLIKTFEQYIELSDQELAALESPFQIFNSSIFQLHTLETDITSDNEKYATVNFMLPLASSRHSIVKPFIGVKGAITFRNICSFTSSMRKILTE